MKFYIFCILLLTQIPQLKAQDFCFIENTNGYVFDVYVKSPDTLYMDSLYWKLETYFIDSITLQKRTFSDFSRDFIPSFSGFIQDTSKGFNLNDFKGVEKLLKSDYGYSLVTKHLYYSSNYDTIVVGYHMTASVFISDQPFCKLYYKTPDACPVKPKKNNGQYYYPVSIKRLRRIYKEEYRMFNLIKRKEDYFYPAFCD